MVYIVNVWAVLVAAIATMVIGMLWYSPLLFGKKFMRLSGVTKEKMDGQKVSGMWKLYVLNFISSIVCSYVLAVLIANTVSYGAWQALGVGLLCWVGFVLTLLLAGVLWESKPWGLYFLNVMYYLFSFSAISLIIGSWR